MSAPPRADVAHVAALARLSLTDAELDRYTTQLAAVLDARRGPRRLRPRAGIAPTAHPFAEHTAVRDDVLVACLDRDEVLAQAPDVEDDRFSVPRIIGEAP